MSTPSTHNCLKINPTGNVILPAVQRSSAGMAPEHIGPMSPLTAGPPRTIFFTCYLEMSEPSSWERRARNLRTAGVICIPVLREDASRRKWADRVWAAMDEFPEYKVKGRIVQRVLGGFGAFGNPSSFHHPTLRRLRRRSEQGSLHAKLDRNGTRELVCALQRPRS